MAQRVLRHLASASLCQAEATEYTQRLDDVRQHREVLGLPRRTSCPRPTRSPPTSPTSQAVEVNFDGITYAKGASVLKQLVAYVGRERVPRRACGATSAGTSTATPRSPTCSAALAESLRPRPVRAGPTQWLRDQPGQHAAAGRSSSTDDGRYASFAIEQGGGRRAPASCAPPARRRPLRRRRARRAGPHAPGRARRRRRAHRGARAGRGRTAGDLVLVNDDDLTYCKMRLDERSLATLVDRIGDIADPLPAHAVLVGGLGHDPRRRAARPATACTLVLAGVRRRDRDRRRAVAAGCRPRRRSPPTPTRRWAPSRAGRRSSATRSTSPARAEPGSDHQLALVTRSPGRCCTPRGAGGARGLARRATAPLEGLAVDTDLRWRLLHALVALGAAGDGRDRGRAGPRRHRDRARGWPSGRGRCGPPRRPRRGLAAGGPRRRAAQRDQRGDHRRLLAPGAAGAAHAATCERYFAEIAEVWDRRSGRAGAAHGPGALPAGRSSRRRVEAADGWLADEHPPRCAAWSPRAATASSGPSRRASSTVAEAARGARR